MLLKIITQTIKNNRILTFENILLHFITWGGLGQFYSVCTACSGLLKACHTISQDTTHSAGIYQHHVTDKESLNLDRSARGDDFLGGLTPRVPISNHPGVTHAEKCYMITYHNQCCEPMRSEREKSWRINLLLN